MPIFCNTELADLYRDAKLISIGLVAEDGRAFHAEPSES